MGKKLAELRVARAPSPLIADWLGASASGAPRAPSRSASAVLFAGRPDRTDAFAVHQYGVAMMILGAALRLMRVDHLDTQAILFEVNRRCGEPTSAPRARASTTCAALRR